MTPRDPLSLAFLIGRDSAVTRQTIESVARIPNVRIAAVLVDTARPQMSRRVKNLRKNIRRDGFGYLPARVLCWANERLDSVAAKVVPEDEVQDLLRRAFPGRCFCLEELAEHLQFKVSNVGNLNSAEAAETLRCTGADLGIVLGTRILKRSTFVVPSLGCINLHKGRVPEYRGMPPAFWELYEGSPTAAVTVHFVDDRLDTGDVIGTRELTIHRNETEQSLRNKLDLHGAELLAECVAAIQAGTATRIPQQQGTIKVRTAPSLRQREELRRRLSRNAELEPGLKQLAKTALYLGFFHLGLYRAFHQLRRKAQVSRASILLYHRVNDFSVDVLTTSTERFAEHLCILKRFYEVRSTGWLVDALRNRTFIPSDTVVIHFDDCYADVLHQAGPVLKACNAPATAFIASGFVGTTRSFEHDVMKYPFQYENFTAEDVRNLPDSGFEVGAHTVNHVNLGKLSLEAAKTEVTNSRSQLEEILQQPVRFFSFPYGRLDNIREDVRSVVKSAGYDAMFSAHGGFANPKTDLFDIPRVGVSSLHRPLDLMIELEGLSLGVIVRQLHLALRRPRPATSDDDSGEALSNQVRL